MNKCVWRGRNLIEEVLVEVFGVGITRFHIRITPTFA